MTTLKVSLQVDDATHDRIKTAIASDDDDVLLAIGDAIKAAYDDGDGVSIDFERKES